jgi:hypothetical protein
MKILAGVLSAALALAALSACASDRSNNDRNQLNSTDQRNLPAKVFDLIGRGSETH